MTERQEILLKTLLDVLATADAPLTEIVMQMFVQTRLGVKVTVSEFKEILDHCDREHFACGLPGEQARVRWSITDKGRHFRAKTNQ